jgi:hypothetical protein
VTGVVRTEPDESETIRMIRRCAEHQVIDYAPPLLPRAYESQPPLSGEYLPPSDQGIEGAHPLPSMGL